MRISGSLDANILLRAILNDIPDQSARAVALIEAHPRLVVCDVAVLETMFVLERHYQLERPHIVEAIAELMKHPHLVLNSVLLEETLGLFATSPVLSPEDCYLAVYAKQNNLLPLWTFDKKLARQSDGLAQELGVV